jgi:hypothetical protein
MKFTRKAYSNINRFGYRESNLELKVIDSDLRYEAQYYLVTLLNNELFSTAIKKANKFFRLKIITHDDLRFIKEIVFLSSIREGVSNFDKPRKKLN